MYISNGDWEIVICGDCSGSGKEDCYECDGGGFDDNDEVCSVCKGDGGVDCAICEGHGKVYHNGDNGEVRPVW